MISLTDIDYELPKSLIAQIPASNRDDSRLMLVNKTNNSITFAVFQDINKFLTPGDLLVFNDTKVIPARLFASKSTGAKIEVLLLEEIEAGVWEVLVKPAKRAGLGVELVFNEDFTAEVIKILEGGKRWLRFNKVDILALSNTIGLMPIPPYIKYSPKLEKFYKERYQTVYAKKPGAVAAPTAGLHFSKDLIDVLTLNGVNTTYLTLDVGIGTFKPISTFNIAEHKMHAENYVISDEVIEKILVTKANGKRVIAVGTTTVRVLEGVQKIFGELKAATGKVDVFIYPGFQFKVIDGLITNFHLPKSTLLLLVSAFAGSDLIKKAYISAIEEQYKFYSFGDAMFIY